jgi:hypothetical protein
LQVVLGLFATLAPSLKPSLITAKNIWVDLVDGLLKLTDRRHLMWQPALVIPEQVNQSNFVLAHRSKGHEYSLGHLIGGFHQFAAHRQFRDE